MHNQAVVMTCAADALSAHAVALAVGLVDGWSLPKAPGRTSGLSGANRAGTHLTPSILDWPSNRDPPYQLAERSNSKRAGQHGQGPSLLSCSGRPPLPVQRRAVRLTANLTALHVAPLAEGTCGEHGVLKSIQMQRPAT